jgi:hypothetical protein
MIGTLSLRNNTFSVNHNSRCKDAILIDFITNLELNQPPENSITAHSSSFQELEQYLAVNFPKYTFGFKLHNTAQPANFSRIFHKPFLITEDWIYFQGYQGGLQQPNLFLLVISEAKSLVHYIKGKQSYLVLKCVESAGKVNLVEVIDNYL